MDQSLKEGEDYFFNDQGLMVLTKSFHRKRGYCCGNGCQECPYEGAEKKPRVKNG